MNRSPSPETSARRSRGAALTELVVVVPVFIALVYASTHLTEAGLHRLEAQQITRYTTWAFAMRELSDFGSGEFKHAQSFERARASVIDEVDGLYAGDLDPAASADAWLPRHGRVLGARYLSPAPSELRNGTAPVVPTLLQANFASSSATSGFLAGAAGLGSSLSEAASGVLERLGLNTRGLVAGRSNVELTPPVLFDARARAAALASAGARRGADLTRFVPGAGGTRLLDAGRPMEGVLIVDSWRVTQGFASTPLVEAVAQRHLANVVDRVHEKLDVAFPGGSAVAGALGLGQLSGTTFEGLWGLLGSGSRATTKVSTVATPLAVVRSAERPGSAGAPVQAGQVALFELVSVPAQEEGAVRRFETAPLFVHPTTTAGGYFEAQRERGPNFMGCPRAQRRGCLP